MFISPDYGDWTHRDDYDPEDADWVDCPTVGRAYEHQIDSRSPDHRHRHIPTLGPWKKGPPP